MDALPFQFFPQITPWHGQTSLCIIVCQENAFLNASLDVLAGWKLYEVYPALWSSWPGNAIVTPLQRALWHLGNWIWYSWYMICTAALKTQVLLFRSRQRLLMGTGISHGSDWGFFFFSHKPLESQYSGLVESGGKNGLCDFYERDSCSITWKRDSQKCLFFFCAYFPLFCIKSQSRISDKCCEATYKGAH